MSQQFTNFESVMRRAIALAELGLGLVEPNPPVGAVIVDDNLHLIGEGYHERFGGPHAEVNALDQAGQAASGATLFVTLEPCCHHAKTPPCTDAIIQAGIRKVIAGIQDPAPYVDGSGIDQLKSAGIDVQCGLLAADVSRLTAPFLKLTNTKMPYVHAKWAMTLDGKIASRTGASQWISNAKSREIVHWLRGRVDAVVVGLGTVLADDPLLTARPAGLRVAARVVVDSRAALPVDSQLIQTINQAPVIVAATESAAPENVHRLEDAGVEVLRLPPGKNDFGSDDARPDLTGLLKELGRRRMTNILVEGGGELLGSFFDHNLIDMVHVFVAPKIVGGQTAITPIAGTGLQAIPQLPQLESPTIEILDGDVYIHGPLHNS